MKLTRFWRVNLAVLSASALFAMHAPQDSFAAVIFRVVLLVILANAIIPKEPHP